jgi:hypothetical protein
MSISPTSAVNDITSIATQLRTGAQTPQRETQLEQQLVSDISAANPSANWGMVAVIADDIADPTISTSAVNVEVAALDRMVVPTTGSTLSTAITTLTQQLRAQDPLPVGETTLTATAQTGATAVTVPSTVGMFNGDKVVITLDNGSTFHDTITTILNNTINLSKALPSQASTGNNFTDTNQQQAAAAASNGGASNIVTTLTGVSPTGTTTVQVASATGMEDGDPIQVQLANGSTFDTTIANTTAATTLSANGATNATTLSLTSLAGLQSGEAVQIVLDNLSTFNTTISDVNIGAGTVTLAAALPSSASSGQSFTATVPAITGSTTLAANGLANASTVTVGNTVGMKNGDTVNIQLDNGTVYSTIIAGISGNNVTLAGPLPSQATTGSTFTDPANIQIGLAAPLPVQSAAGGTLTDTAGAPATTNTISFSSPLTAGATTAATTLSLASVAGMAVGDTVQILLDNGSLFNTTLTDVDSLANTVTLAAPLPSAAENLLTATLTDNISTNTQGSAYTAAVTVSPQMQAVLQLQLNVLINAANSNANAQSLQTIEANLISSSLTTAQFQQDVSTLIESATSGLTPGLNLTFEA